MIVVPSRSIPADAARGKSSLRMFGVKILTFSAVAGGLYLDASLLFGWR
jgi:hypothetical protein